MRDFEERNDRLRSRSRRDRDEERPRRRDEDDRRERRDEDRPRLSDKLPLILGLGGCGLVLMLVVVVVVLVWATGVTAPSGISTSDPITRANFDKIQNGMSIAEVEQILGPPHSRGDPTAPRDAAYAWASSRQRAGITVYFKNGCVVSKIGVGEDGRW